MFACPHIHVSLFPSPSSSIWMRFKPLASSLSTGSWVILHSVNGRQNKYRRRKNNRQYVMAKYNVGESNGKPSNQGCGSLALSVSYYFMSLEKM